MPAARILSRRPSRVERSLACAICLMVIGSALAGAASGAPTSSQSAAWSLRDGDRVVLLGDTFIEREGDRGFIETALVATHPEASLTFRNLGWSGDTVWAESRGVFDQPAKGYARMLALVREIDPTIVFVAYGRNESYRGVTGLDAFRGQLAKLCDDLRSRAGGAAGDSRSPDRRLVLVTPHRFETPDAVARNAALASYCEAIREVAGAKRAGLVDLFTAPVEPIGDAARTENGVHLSDAGYAACAETFVRAAGRSLPAGFATTSGGLRRLVVDKNRLFFHRWRPANETYIFLFRSHEQGNNAVEIPQFDPLVTAAEAKVRAAVAGSRPE